MRSMCVCVCVHVCACISAASTLLSDARESRERLTKYVERWRVVRDRREALAEAVRNAAGVCELCVSVCFVLSTRLCYSLCPAMNAIY